jgi:hypothetical protein
MTTVTLDWKWAVGLAAGFSTIVGAVTTGALLLDRRIETVHNRIEARMMLSSLCDKGETGDEDVDAAREQIISSLGGCP